MSTLPRRPPPPVPGAGYVEEEEYEEEEDYEEEEEEEEEEDDYRSRLRNGMFLDDNANMEVKAFYEEYCCDLPQLVMVSQGQYGEIDLDTFCAGQVMLIHSYGTQSRVVTRDARGRTFSIPTDYPLKFKVIKSRTKELEEQSLSEILEEHSLPVQVRFSVPDTATFYIGSDQQIAKDILNMVLADTYQETYMLANCLNSDDIDEKTVLVPVYLKDATLSLVTGVVGKTKEQFEEYYDGLLEHMKKVKVDIKIGNKDIAFLSEDCLDQEDHVYDYINPQGILKMSLDDKGGLYTPMMDAEDFASIYNVVNDELCTPKLPERDKPKPKPKATKTKKGKESSDKPELPVRSKILSDKDTSCSDVKHEYVNDIPRKEVAPISFLKNLTKSSHDKKAVKTDWGKQLESGQVLLEELSINEIGQVMRELKLDKHVHAFKKRQIDGLIASELDKDVLKDELGFSSLEAIKFLKFTSTGHIPK